MGVGSFTLPQNADVVTGVGTVNKVQKIVSEGVLGDSQIEDNGSRVWIGGTDNGVDKLQVQGNINFGDNNDIGSYASPAFRRLKSYNYLNTFQGSVNIEDTNSDSNQTNFSVSLLDNSGVIFQPFTVRGVDGSFLIGQTNTNGVDKLQVNGSGSFNGKLRTIAGSLEVNSPLNLIASFGNVDGVNDNTVLQVLKNGDMGDIYFQAYGNINGTFKNIHFGGFSSSFASAVLTINNNTNSVLINTTTDNGVDKLQVNGSGYFSDNIKLQNTKGLIIFNSEGSNIQALSVNGTGLNIGSVFYNGNVNLYAKNNFIFNTDDGSGLDYRLRLQANGNLLVGNGFSDNGVDKLQVNGSIKSTSSVQVGANATVESASLVGSIRYRSTANSSFAEMCMQTGASTYAWVILKENSW